MGGLTEKSPCTEYKNLSFYFLMLFSAFAPVFSLWALDMDLSCRSVSLLLQQK